MGGRKEETSSVPEDLGEKSRRRERKGDPHEQKEATHLNPLRTGEPGRTGLVTRGKTTGRASSREGGRNPQNPTYRGHVIKRKSKTLRGKNVRTKLF